MISGQPGSADLLRVVAACQGHRCRALLAAQDPDGMTALRDAARDSRHGVLVSTGCAGPCAHAPVVMLGTGVVEDGTLRTAHTALLGPVGPPQVAALASHLRGDGPALAAALDHVRLTVVG